jgi:hypothetical protein
MLAAKTCIGSANQRNAWAVPTQKRASAMPIEGFVCADESMSYSGDKSDKPRPKSVPEALRDQQDVTRVFVSQVRGSSRYCDVED